MLYELHEKVVLVKDTQIEKQLSSNLDDVSLKETAIKEREDVIAEYRCEHEFIQKAAASFALFLKKHSITAYNDATFQYIDMLIQDEEMKVLSGGNAFKLNRARYQEYINLLESEMAREGTAQLLDEAGVEELATQLYQLKHYGNDLSALRNVVSKVHSAMYRELPFRVQRQSSVVARDDDGRIARGRNIENFHEQAPQTTGVAIPGKATFWKSKPVNRFLSSIKKQF